MSQWEETVEHRGAGGARAATNTHLTRCSAALDAATRRLDGVGCVAREVGLQTAASAPHAPACFPLVVSFHPADLRRYRGLAYLHTVTHRSSPRLQPPPTLYLQPQLQPESAAPEQRSTGTLMDLAGGSESRRREGGRNPAAPRWRKPPVDPMFAAVFICLQGQGLPKVHNPSCRVRGEAREKTWLPSFGARNAPILPRIGLINSPLIMSKLTHFYLISACGLRRRRALIVFACAFNTAMTSPHGAHLGMNVSSVWRRQGLRRLLWGRCEALVRVNLKPPGLFPASVPKHVRRCHRIQMNLMETCKNA
ncbi:unnamed protein product [Pleuronectes platessa]|uniref:Uncharacterized protein n=1 Tax=Pleuronectes platessa TaxID=8262 RepID=A0A9N7YHC9_PLEPL|nr:unnamed protein product [Pleuronectes platessa]